MLQVTLGSTGITVPQNGFGALPIQRISEEEAVGLLQKAYLGGIRFLIQPECTVTVNPNFLLRLEKCGNRSILQPKAKQRVWNY